MTRDDVIRMAREAGINYRKLALEFYSTQCDGVDLEDLERFAQLVAAAEREACAKVVEAFEPDDKDLAIAIRARGNA